MITCDLVNFVLQSLINGALVKNKRKPSPDSEFLFMQCAMLLLSDEKCHLFSGGCNAVFAICHAGTETTLCASNLCSSSHGYVLHQQPNGTGKCYQEMSSWATVMTKAAGTVLPQHVAFTNAYCEQRYNDQPLHHCNKQQPSIGWPWWWYTCMHAALWQRPRAAGTVCARSVALKVIPSTCPNTFDPVITDQGSFLRDSIN